MSMFSQLFQTAKCGQCDELAQEVRRLSAANSALKGPIVTLKERNVELLKPIEELTCKNSQLNANHGALKKTIKKDAKMMGRLNASNGVVPYATVVLVRQEAEEKLSEKAHEIETLKESLVEKEAQWTKERDELNAKIAELQKALAVRKLGDDEDFGFEQLTIEDTVF